MLCESTINQVWTEVLLSFQMIHIDLQKVVGSSVPPKNRILIHAAHVDTAGIRKIQWSLLNIELVANSNLVLLNFGHFCLIQITTKVYVVVFFGCCFDGGHNWPPA